MSTLTTDRQPPRIAVEIVRLLLKALVESHKTADRESLDSDTRPAANDAPTPTLNALAKVARNE